MQRHFGNESGRMNLLVMNKFVPKLIFIDNSVVFMTILQNYWLINYL